VSNANHPSIGLLDGKVVVITGAGRGMGKAMARVFAREGARVLAVDISGAETDVAAELGPAVVPCNCDVSQEDQVESMFACALEVFGKVDALVNVAGTLAHREAEVTVEEYERLTAVNLRGVLLCSKHAVRAMVPGGGGAIVNISTVGALNTEARASIVYSAAKAGVNSVTKSFAVQYGAQGIRVNAMASGITVTEQYLKAPPEIVRELSAKAALQRAADSEEQAQVAAFLVSDRASFLTGAIIPVDGGWSARLA
jgi:NAD(P)-dependent dehydrogenase (short-subunit alcohol dehydrogenase family)